MLRQAQHDKKKWARIEISGPFCLPLKPQKEKRKICGYYKNIYMLNQLRINQHKETGQIMVLDSLTGMAKIGSAFDLCKYSPTNLITA